MKKILFAVFFLMVFLVACGDSNSQAPNCEAIVLNAQATENNQLEVTVPVGFNFSNIKILTIAGDDASESFSVKEVRVQQCTQTFVYDVQTGSSRFNVKIQLTSNSEVLAEFYAHN